MSRIETEIAPKSAETVRLGGHSFDPLTESLFDADGNPVRLRAQSARVLAVLCRRPNEVVSKEQIHGEVWGNRSVTQDSLVQCIGDIRRALGDEDRHLVRTVDRRGYMLRVGRQRQDGRRPLAVAVAAAAAVVTFVLGGLMLRPDATSSAMDLDALLAAPQAERPTLAVLPFRNLSGAADQTYFSDGLTEDIATDLSRIPDLAVISAASGFAYRDSPLPIDRIAAELGADYVLRGSVRRSGETMRVNVNLIDGTGVNVWAGRIDGQLSDIFQVQDEVTRAIIDALPVSVTSREEGLLQRAYSVDPEAYDLLLRGLPHLRNLTAEGVAEARHHFLRAAEIDPGYARAYAALALSYGQSIVFRLTESPKEEIARGLEYSDTALRLDETLPQTQFARAVLLLASRRHDEAVAAARTSVELDRSYADGYAVLAQTSAYSGNLNDALKAIRIAKRLNPRHTFAYLWVEGHILYQMRRYSDALLVLEDVVRRNPSFYVGLLTLSATYGQLGMAEDAEWLNAEIAVLSPDVSATREGDTAPYKRSIDRDHFVEGMLKSGLPH